MKERVKGHIRPQQTSAADSWVRAMAQTLLTIGIMASGTTTPYLVGTLAPHLIRDWGLSPMRYGLLASATYFIAVVVSRFIGRACDVQSTRASGVLLMFAALVAWTGLGLSPNYWLALIATAIGGLTLAASNPVTNRMVSEVRPKNFGAALGFKQAGVPLSAFVVGLAAPPIAGATSWHYAVLSCVPVGAVISLGILIMPAAPSSRPRARRTAPSGTVGHGVGYLAGYALLMGCGGGVLNAFVALYAVSRLGESETTGGRLLALMGLGGAVSRVAWAQASQSRSPTRILGVLASVAVVSSALIATSSAAGTFVLLIGVGLAGLSASSWLGVAMVAVYRLSDTGIGDRTGVVSRGFYAGLLLAPVLGGALISVDPTYTLIWAAQGMCFLLAVALVALRRQNSSRL